MQKQLNTMGAMQAHSYRYNISIMKFKPLILLLLVLNLHCSQIPEIEKRHYIFPHTLYTYWNTDIISAPTFTQLCVNAMRKNAKLNGWDFVLLNSKNINDFLSEESKQQIKFILSHKQTITVTSFADLARIFVLRDNGGMWLDTSSFFVRDLSWIEDIAKQQYIDNMLSSQPDMIMFSYNQHVGGNRTIVFDERINKDVILFPGLEIWCFITKPRCKFMNDLVEGIVSIYQKGTEEQFKQEQLKQGYKYLSEIETYFIYSNFHFQTLLQRKQRQIDANRSAFKERYSIEYYNIWSIEAVFSGLKLFHSNEWLQKLAINNLFYSPIQQIKSNRNGQIYLMKFPGYLNHAASGYIDLVYSMRCLSAIDPIPQNSIINEFLFKLNEDADFVIKLRDLQKNKMQGFETGCNNFKPRTKMIVGITLLLNTLVVFGSIFALYRCLKNINKKRPSGHDLET